MAEVNELALLSPPRAIVKLGGPVARGATLQYFK